MILQWFDQNQFKPNLTPGVPSFCGTDLVVYSRSNLPSIQVQEDEWLEQDSEQVFVIEGAGLKRLVTDEKVFIRFLLIFTPFLYTKTI